MKNIKAIIFDYDGVLVDSCNYHYEQCSRLSKNIFSIDEFLAHHEGQFYHPNLEKRNIFEGIDWYEYANLLVETYPKLSMEDKIKKVLNYLSKIDIQLFVVSSGNEFAIKKHLQHHGFLDIFSGVYGLQTDKLKVNKFNKIFKEYLLKNNECIFVTDTLGDVHEANEVNIPTVGVTYGYHTAQTLKKGKLLALIDDPIEILNFLKKR